MWFNFNIPLLYSDRYKDYKVHGDAPGPGIVLRTTHAYSLIGFESLDSFNISFLRSHVYFFANK
jgi:hypothetical protein